MQTREDRQKLEEATLAPYAARSGASKGRHHPDQAHGYRTEFQRDRDRIVFSRSFRRLEYKTQVFVNGTADHYRTRLTHTMEMASIGRTMARALRVNEDLTETIALAHDIGHSPFGHVGERALHELMIEDGGFDHNVQSLRWVERLEQQYPDFNGLNLTWEVRAGLRKHMAGKPGAVLDGHPIGPFQYVEAQIADIADDIAYQTHDPDDGLEARIITEEQLMEHEIWRRALERAERKYAGMGVSHRINAVLRALLDLQVNDVLEATTYRLRTYDPQSPEDVMQCPERIVAFSDGMTALIAPFRAFLTEEMYRHPDVDAANREAARMMSRLFLFYVENPNEMGKKARARIENEGLKRTACDYVSGCTDRYALEEYIKFGLDRGGGERD